ncbi:MAG: extracellular solute-binding protein [Alphaproteobacteria bacterium]|nr:extracellular solute-binding protein [Alphaproteobacteria bacterium]MBV8409434.1 extracellular solute-binding protein [Alphaproteobacteria bacterium]
MLDNRTPLLQTLHPRRWTSRVCTGLLLISLAAIHPSASQAQSPTLRLGVVDLDEGDGLVQLSRDYKEARVEAIRLGYSKLREQLVASRRNKTADFDVILIDDPWFTEFAPSLLPLRNVPADLLSDVVPASLRLARYPYGTGELRALPFVGNTELLFVRKDIRADFGWTGMPTEWQALASQAKQVAPLARQRGKKGTFGYAIHGESGAPIVSDFLPIYWSFGGRLLSEGEGPKKVLLDEGAFIDALQVYRTLMQASPPNAITFDWSEMTSAFVAGSMFELNWPVAIPTIEGALGQGSFGDLWEVALPPAGKAKATSMIGNWLLAIPDWAPNPRQAEAERFVVWALANQEKAAYALAPPTRRSVFEKLAAERGKGYFATILEALEISTPRDRDENWSEIESAVSGTVKDYLTGKLEAEQAARTLRNRLVAIVER